MKTRSLPLLVATLLLSIATSEARSRVHSRHRQRPAEIALGRASGGDEGGPLARSRGLSQGESAAVGEVLAEIARLPSNGANAAANPPTRRYSPDYYRVYHRPPVSGATRRVAVQPAAAPAAKPPAPVAPTVKPAVIAVVPPVVKPTKVAALKAPPVAHAAAPATGIRMAFTPRTPVVSKATPAPAPKPAPGAPIRAVFRDQPPR